MPMPLSNQYIDVMDDDMCEELETFDPLYVGQILDSRNKIFDAMCKETGCSQYDQLRSYMFDTRSITKTMLAEWLETVCRILDAYAEPVLTAACNMTKEVGALKNSRIEDQKKIIELQEELIKKKDLELDSVKSEVRSTVQTEVQSFSSVLKTTCTKALAPRKMQAALKTAAEVEDKSRNLIVFGVQEKKEENLEEAIQDVFSHLDVKPRIVSCSRLGRDRVDTETSSCKPIRVRLSDSDQVRQLLIKKLKLRSVEGYEHVYLSPDRTVEQRATHKKLVDEMKRKRVSEPDKKHYIRNNLVVTVSSGT